MTTTGTSTPTIAPILEGACARQVQAELHYDGGTNHVHVGRIRFLELKPDLIIVSKPTYGGDDKPIPADRPVSVHFSLRQSRYRFHSVMVDRKCLRQVDSGRWMGDSAIRRPSSVTRSQRRRNLRLSMAGCQPIMVEAVRPDPDVVSACALNAKRLGGQLVDLSCSGAAVLFDRNDLADCSPGELFYLTFTLPEEPEVFCLLGSTRQVRTISSSNSIRIGFDFRCWYQGKLAHDQRRLSRFIAGLERRKLRRRK